MGHFTLERIVSIAENPNNFFFTKKLRKQSYSDLTSPPNKAVMASSELRSRPQMTF